METTNNAKGTAVVRGAMFILLNCKLIYMNPFIDNTTYIYIYIYIYIYMMVYMMVGFLNINTYIYDGIYDGRLSKYIYIYQCNVDESLGYTKSLNIGKFNVRYLFLVRINLICHVLSVEYLNI